MLVHIQPQRKVFLYSFILKVNCVAISIMEVIGFFASYSAPKKSVFILFISKVNCVAISIMGE